MIDQYENLCTRVANTGVWIANERTGNDCLTVINADLEYDVSDNFVPVVTTRKAPWKLAIAEFLGYIRGYQSAEQFRSITYTGSDGQTYGCNTWNANANSKVWQSNSFCKGEDDLGRCYGVQGRGWSNPEGEKIDQLQKIFDDLARGYDNRGEILSFWNPGEFDRACLRPCMHTHTFSILEDQLFLTSYQRSDDLPLGHVANQIQCAFFLMITAQIVGLKANKCFHKVVNAHFYRNQHDLMVNTQLKRTPKAPPKLIINPDIKSLKDLETWVTPDDFELEGYDPDPGIKYPFSV
ncbi:MAG: thymidylate synthase [Pseudomonadales bacterium]